MISDWKHVRLGDYIDSCLGKMLDQKKNKGIFHPYLGNINVRWGEFELTNLSKMKFEDTEHERYSLKKGDLVVCEGGSEPGRCAIWEGEISDIKIQKALHRIRTLPGLVSGYLYYWFLLAGKNGSLEPFFTGTAIKHLTGRSLANLKIALPPVSYQEKCASILNSIDRKIKHNKKINKTLEQMTLALFKSWFVDFEPVKAKISVLEAGGSQEDATLAAMTAISGKNVDALEFFEREHPEQYDELKSTAELFPSAMQDGETGEIPKGWETPAVKDVANTIKGKSYKSTELDCSRTALVTLKSFNRGGGYRLDGLKEYTGKYKPEQEVFAGDLIIAYTDVTQAADVIGKPAMVISDSRYEHLVISLDVAVVRPFNDSLKYYLYGVARTEQFQQHTNAHSTGTTVLHLSKNAVPDYKFILANEGLVNIYAQYAKSIFSKINTAIEENNCLSELRDALLPKLLSGEITLPEAEQAVNEVENV